MLFIMLSTMTVITASAQSIDACKRAVTPALDCAMGTNDSKCPSGYFKQLSDLLSTNLPTYLLLDEVQQLARDAQIELKGICQQVGTFQNIDPFYVSAYDLQACKAINVAKTDTGPAAEITNFCLNQSDALLNSFLDELRQYVTKQAIRTSVEPLVQRMRSLNARLSVLISEFGRVVGNFYTFNFRLGDTITGDRD